MLMTNKRAHLFGYQFIVSVEMMIAGKLPGYNRVAIRLARRIIATFNAHRGNHCAFYFISDVEFPFRGE